MFFFLCLVGGFSLLTPKFSLLRPHPEVTHRAASSSCIGQTWSCTFDTYDTYFLFDELSWMPMSHIFPVSFYDYRCHPGWGRLLFDISDLKKHCHPQIVSPQTLLPRWSAAASKARYCSTIPDKLQAPLFVSSFTRRKYNKESVSAGSLDHSKAHKPQYAGEFFCFCFCFLFWMNPSRLLS